MTLIIVLVFVGVFAVAVLLMVATGTGASEQAKRTLERLDSALATGKTEMSDLLVDVRRTELMSSIPWLDRWLLKIELAPRLRSLLYQANLKWTVGGLMLM